MPRYAEPVRGTYQIQPFEAHDPVLPARKCVFHQDPVALGTLEAARPDAIMYIIYSGVKEGPWVGRSSLVKGWFRPR